MLTPLYDRIGKAYNQTRCADPWLTQRMLDHLSLVDGGRYLDIGCGTGNYTCALARKGGQWVGMDPSGDMLSKARQQNADLDWRIGTSEQTGLESGSMDGILCSLSIHHWPDLERAFDELSRVLKPAGRLVLFTSSPAQMTGYWLGHYFPRMMADSIQRMPDVTRVTGAMSKAGLTVVKTESYTVRPDLEDHFLYCGKDRPERYLQPEIRQGISSFSVLALQEEVNRGLTRMEKDIQSGAIREIIASHAHDNGDYLFLISQKSI